mmetsp:Transcript_10520/g.15756  ORF Transcript_10520/g.15756 Transcript_10520/m.15756 type:complete len:141 (+) Transcript_10520:28-450(+)
MNSVFSPVFETTDDDRKDIEGFMALIHSHLNSEYTDKSQFYGFDFVEEVPIQSMVEERFAWEPTDKTQRRSTLSSVASTRPTLEHDQHLGDLELVRASFEERRSRVSFSSPTVEPNQDFQEIPQILPTRTNSSCLEKRDI